MILHVGPAEVVHPADVVQGRAHGQQPPHRLVDGDRGHVVGVDLGVGRVEGQAQGQPPGRFRPGPEDRGVAGHRGLPAHQGLQDAAPLHFVVVLAGDPLPGADIGTLQHGQEQRPVIRGLAQHRLTQAALRRQPFAVELPGRELLLQQGEIHIGAGAALVLDLQDPAVGIAAR